MSTFFHVQGIRGLHDNSPMPSVVGCNGFFFLFMNIIKMMTIAAITVMAMMTMTLAIIAGLEDNIITTILCGSNSKDENMLMLLLHVLKSSLISCNSSI